MSKIAILKSLPTPADLRESVSQIQAALDQSSRRLDQVTSQVKSLEQLPELVADQVSQALSSLDPLTRLPDQVQTALLAFDKIAQAQRTTLDALTQEMGNRAVAGMQAKAGELDASIKALTLATEDMYRGVKISMDILKTETGKISALPQTLTQAATDAATAMQTEAQVLIRAADRVRPSAWLTFLQMVGAAMLGALLVLAGQAVLK